VVLLMARVQSSRLSARHRHRLRVMSPRVSFGASCIRGLRSVRSIRVG